MACHAGGGIRNPNIIIEDDVWIGYESLILSGVTIGRGSIVGARSVVTKDVPPYSVYVGNKVIRRRFSDGIIQKLMEIDYSTIEHTPHDSFSSYFDLAVDETNVDEILTHFM